MEFSADNTSFHTPSAVLRDGQRVVAKVYLSPDEKTLRIALPEMASETQIKIDWKNRFIDFKRMP